MDSIDSESLAEIFARHSTSTALIDGDLRITYEQLDHAVSTALRHGVFDPSSSDDAPAITFIAALGVGCTVLELAAMRAGRTWTVLEVRTPIDQLIESIEQIGGPVVCLDTEMSAELAARRIDLVESESLRIERLLSDPQPDHDGPNDASEKARRVLFTSGSTGRPKGVVMPLPPAHENAIVLEWGALTTDRTTITVAITAPPSFGLSWGQVLLALRNGGTGVYVDLARHSASRFREIIAEHDIAAISGPAPLILAMVEAPTDGSLDSVRSILLAGQLATGNDIEALRKVLPRTTILNCYGSTEAGILTTSVFRPGDPPPPPGPLPAGRPTQGTEMMALDEDDRPVLVGGIGRLVARARFSFTGYWNDPETTAAKFVDLGDGDRWIRTGDLGRIDEKGVVHVVGRTDDLVKIRGRFVNPRDIDTILEGDVRVTQVTTLALPLDAARQLATFVVTSGPDVTARELRHLLAQSLPHFALPKRIVIVDSIPMTDRGKIDRLALVGMLPVDDDRTPELPSLARSNEEELIVRLFKEVLETDVTYFDDFFACGGDSLAAAELIAIVADEFDIDLSPAQLIAHPTPALLLGHLRERPTRTGSGTADRPDLLALHESEHPTSIFWVLSGDNGFSMARLSRHLAPIRSWSVRELGWSPGERPLSSIPAIGEHNAAAICRARSPRTVVIGFSISCILAVETAAAMARRGVQTDLLVLVDPTPARSLDDYLTPPHPLLRPRTALRFHRRRWTDVHRPSASTDPIERSERFIRRTAILSRDHPMPVHAGPTAIVRTEQFASIREPSVIDQSVKDQSESLVIPGTHKGALARSEPLVAALSKLLTSHGLG